MQGPSDETRRAVAQIAAEFEGLELLVLFGSRARPDERAESDWDFGYVASAPFDPALLQARLMLLFRSDDVDVVDLSRANGLLRFRAAREGIALHQSREDSFWKFQRAALCFWFDVEPILEAAYLDVLRDIRT